MILKPCPFCRKDIPRSISVCPYCHRDEGGKAVQIDSTAAVQAPINEKYFEQLLSDLASEDPFHRDQAVLRMAQHGFGVVQALISILSDFAKPGLAGVARSLGKIGDRRAVPVLAQAVKMGDEELRIASAWALAQFHEPEVLPILLSEAERPHPVIQSYLAHILGTFQDHRVVPVLSKLAEHPNREVSFQAISALAEVGDRAAIPVLKKTWRTRNPLVRAASAASLRRLGGKPSWIPPYAFFTGMVILILIGVGAGWFYYK